MTSQNLSSDYYECTFVLTYWVKGTDLLSEIIDQIEQRITTLRQLFFWKNNHLIIPKPSLSSSEVFTFWVHENIIDRILLLPGIRGGFRIKEEKTLLYDSSTYKGRKQTPRPRRVLLDIGIDAKELIHKLNDSGLETELLWTHISDLLHYEIIDICTSQYIDLIVTTNPRLLMPSEEWLEYLIPHRTRIIVVAKEKLKSLKELVSLIYNCAHSKRKFKTRENQYQSFLTFNKEEI